MTVKILTTERRSGSPESDTKEKIARPLASCAALEDERETAAARDAERARDQAHIGIEHGVCELRSEIDERVLGDADDERHVDAHAILSRGRRRERLMV